MARSCRAWMPMGKYHMIDANRGKGLHMSKALCLQRVICSQFILGQATTAALVTVFFGLLMNLVLPPLTVIQTYASLHKAKAVLPKLKGAGAKGQKLDFLQPSA